MTNKQVITGGLGLALLLGAGTLAARASGIFNKWDGTYSGVLRPSGAAGSVLVLNNPEKGGRVLVLNAPDLKGGSCAITFEGPWRTLAPHFGSDQICGGPDGDYAVVSYESSMTLDGDSLAAKVTFIKFTPGAPGAVPDTTNEVVIDFVGTRSADVAAKLPPLFPTSTASLAVSGATPTAASPSVNAALGTCLVDGTKCWRACPRSGPPKLDMTPAESRAWDAAFAKDKKCRSACDIAEAGCEKRAKGEAPEPPEPPSTGIPMPHRELVAICTQKANVCGFGCMGNDTEASLGCLSRCADELQACCVAAGTSGADGSTCSTP